MPGKPPFARRAEALPPDAEELLELSVRDLVARIAAETPTPASGSASALVATLAAALVGMAARFSRAAWPEAGGAVAQANALQERAAPLAQSDSEAYEAVLAARREHRDLPQPDRDALIGDALALAAEVPLAIAEVAADIAQLGALVAEKGNPNVAGDAAAGAVLAESAARAAANLVAINLGTRYGDLRLVRAQALADTAAVAARRALAVTS